MIKYNELTLKTINDLLTMSFFIPAYQRGYRWSSRQVIELLEDVYEFCDRKIKVNDDFYCLQPVVVKQKGEQWELVDGQQRLTTILLILGYFNSRFAEDFRKQLYSLEYETRPESRDYLISLDDSRSDQNIDFHFIFEAYSNIRAWFKNKSHRINDIESVFLNKVKIIWYQLGEAENVIDVFTRLNMGKIPLVNAELVKALFLKSSNFLSTGQTVRYLQQLSIAQDWDAIEKRLQDDTFWYFVSNQPIASNRIEFVLALTARKLNSEGILDNDKLKVFLQFNKTLQKNNNEIDVIKEWLKIKQCFMTLEEWFNDKVLFHLVGYLVSQKVAIETIFDLRETCKSKYTFRQNLIEQIFKKALANKNLNEVSKALIEAELSELNYETDAKKIRSILLLFNITSLLANPITNSRFQFNKYKLDNWDIEHIRSVASDMPRDRKKQIMWLENVVDYISGVNTIHLEERSTINRDTSQAIKKEATELLKTDFDDQQFGAIYLRILSFYDPWSNDLVDHSIGNLTLLDSTTNRSYKNAVFPIKRLKIITLDKEATFVPLCTKNVFLKYYSKQVDKMLYWEAKDSQYHQKAMVDSLYGFFCGEGVHI
ncbi:DUF262 domain-containing protein [Acinetobacter beijerinckii]|uniref:DUF262 domain-containing protein n=1 Tax=Acinetobacter beijerinckii TaxID=262668 RepID=UPI004054E915